MKKTAMEQGYQLLQKTSVQRQKNGSQDKHAYKKDTVSGAGRKAFPAPPTQAMSS